MAAGRQGTARQHSQEAEGPSRSKSCQRSPSAVAVYLRRDCTNHGGRGGTTISGILAGGPDTTVICVSKNNRRARSHVQGKLVFVSHARSCLDFELTLYCIDASVSISTFPTTSKSDLSATKLRPRSSTPLTLLSTKISLYNTYAFFSSI